MSVWTRVKAVAMRWQRGTAGTFSRYSFFGGRGGFWGENSKSRPDHASVVMAPLLWICRTMPEAPIVVEQKKGKEWEVVDDHDMVVLLERPNPYYSGELMLTATVLSLHLDGNGYWLKGKSTTNLATVELWWVPSNEMTPCWPLDGSVFISHYEYRPGGYGDPVRVEVEDVIHFRLGIDEDNIRLGRSPLASVMREILTDREAAEFAQVILANCGIPGLVISPDGDVEMSDDEFKSVKKEIQGKFSGRHRGEPFVASSRTKVEQFGFSPEQMDMRTLRRVPEERVTAVTGVAAIVAGLGAGLDRSTFSNFAEAREASYESAIIPLQRIIAAEVRHQLLPDFETNLRKFRVKYDLSEVRILQEDETAKTTRKLAELTAGAITLGTYLRETGREADDSHDVYLRNMSIVEVPVEEFGQPTPPPSAFGLPESTVDADGNPVAPDDPAAVNAPPKPPALPPAPDPALNGAVA